MTFDPNIGRWMEEDPIGFDGGDMNLSRFVGNNPTSATDPTGLYLIAKNGGDAQNWLRNMGRFGLKSGELSTFTLPSGAVLIFTTADDWESLFRYADSRWAKIFDDEYRRDEKTKDAWKKMVQERNDFLLAAGVGGQTTWRKSVLSVGYKDKQWVYNKIDLSPEDIKALSDCPVSKSDYTAIDLGGEGRYKKKEGRAVLNVNIRSTVTGRDKSIPNFIYGDAAGRLPFGDKSVNHIIVESPTGGSYDKWVKEMLRIIKSGGTMQIYGNAEHMEKDFLRYFTEQNVNITIMKGTDYLGLGGMGWTIAVPK